MKQAVVQDLAANKELGFKVTWEEIARKHAVPVGKTTVDEMVGSMTFWCRFLDDCSHVTLMI